MAQILNPQPADLDLKVDTSTSGTTYVAQAAIGSATSDAVWQIMRVVTANGITTLGWADGDSNFNNVYDNRTGLTYSS